MKDWSSAEVPDLISVIVTTYNREDALEAVLSALSRQSDRGFEVVIADDGSGSGTAAVVERWRSRLGVPLGHVWQADRGFRAAEIRNRAILACRGDYCIFLDGDCIVRPDFVATHRRLAEPGWFVTGNRVLLSPRPHRRRAARRLAARSVERIRVGRRSACAAASIGLAAVLRLPLGPLRKLGPRRWRGARSCNLAVWRCRSRTGRRLRRQLQRLGPRGFRSADPLAAWRPAPQGRALRDRRHSSVAPRGRPSAIGRQRCTARCRAAQRSHARAARPVGAARHRRGRPRLTAKIDHVRAQS